MAITWDDRVDAKLLFAIITTSATKIDYKAVAEIIGEGCTPKAIQHRLARIKLKANEGNRESSSPAKTPKSKSSCKNGKVNKKRAAEILEEEAGDSKKIKQGEMKEADSDE
ncbi:hypothetical protein MGYG_03829 [Nannizzia gypsea CBS 118893]|uniref:Myb-like DNA-binding domain-containing protein n=1 Tax=Arthroderma gypseum (strain ATCC MYA-4604 / CBS 118893) TaxID=535722 RepID=E4UU58_ARTGP|nr:hypothetical protein MGYG_03829 [Nannizzia gypsea CBS 118893]EFR00825.1 hypothetical protein MGYG_03829 [Nannizzia gypsea CBS 118893]